MGISSNPPSWIEVCRQHPSPPYILDFFCRSAGLAIEVDGYAHDTADRPQRDARRDEILIARGITTLRLPASEVRDNFEGAVQLIVHTCRARTPPPLSCAERSPSPAKAGEDAA